MSAKRFADAWDKYARDVLPKEAPEVQRVECRRAFYAGGAALFYAILSGVGRGEQVTDAEIALLDGIKDELEAYAREIAELASKEPT